MKGRAFIDRLRKEWASGDSISREARILLADAVEIADEACRELIRSEFMQAAGYYVCNIAYEYPEGNDDELRHALAYLGRRGLIVRKEGEPHMVRFVEEQ
jgi:hypothetical protein